VVAATRERKAMHVVLSGAAFDPEEDLRFLPATALVDRALAERGGGRLEFRITDYDAVAAGATLSSRREGLLDDAPFLDDVDLSLGERPLAPDAVYPAETIAPASALTVELTLREAGRARGEAVAGTLVVRLDRAERDRQDAPTGELRIELDAAVIGEAIAECNASGGRASVCEPARP
jgi:hypothetical protein